MKFATAYNAGDAAAIAALFTPGDVLNSPSGAAVKGHEGTEKAFAGRKGGWNETVAPKRRIQSVTRSGRSGSRC
jgi:ketosteroid isomerase-like protein